MKFEEAVKLLKEDRKVRRKSWNKRNYITVGKDELIIDENDYAISFVLNDFEADDWEVVKKKKKVKLRDLTMEQYKKWVAENCGLNVLCRDCLFRRVECDTYSKDVWYLNKDLYSDKFLDQEIEIEE